MEIVAVRNSSPGSSDSKMPILLTYTVLILTNDYYLFRNRTLHNINLHNINIVHALIPLLNEWINNWGHRFCSWHSVFSLHTNTVPYTQWAGGRQKGKTGERWDRWRKHGDGGKMRKDKEGEGERISQEIPIPSLKNLHKHFTAFRLQWSAFVVFKLNEEERFHSVSIT